MAIQKAKLFMYEYVNHRAPERYVSAYAEHEMSHMKTEIVMLGETEVDIDYPEIDTTPLQVKAIEDAIQSERADSQVRVNILLDRLSKLKAIGHDAPVNA